MRVVLSPPVAEASRLAPAAVRKAFYKQLDLLRENRRHPSLRTKKFDEVEGLWQARVNRDWRFYFSIENDTYHILKLVPHPK